MLAGGLVVGERSVTLADIRCPVLIFVGTTDDIAPPATVRAIRKAAPRAEVYECSMRAGHFGLVVGSKAVEITWPAVSGWVDWRESRGELPTTIGRIEERTRKERREEPAAPELGDLSEEAGLALSFGRDLVSGVLGAVTDRAQMLWRLAETGLPQVALLARLARVRGRTRVSPGLVLAEQAKAHPDRTFFLFEGRAYSFADADRRIDAVVRGLISVGVRVGQRVGVMMRTRPSAIAVVTAASRLGAIAVMLREGSSLAAELAVGGVEHLVADPEYADEARRVFGKPVLVLGGGAPRSLGEGLLDLSVSTPRASRSPVGTSQIRGRRVTSLSSSSPDRRRTRARASSATRAGHSPRSARRPPPPRPLATPSTALPRSTIRPGFSSASAAHSLPAFASPSPRASSRKPSGRTSVSTERPSSSTRERCSAISSTHLPTRRRSTTP
jgi:putative long chain acyl-CoA synthase